MKGALIRIVSSGLPGREGEERELSGGGITLGRSDDCEVVLKDPRVSRRHARIECDGEGFRVRDLGSVNGVIVDGKKITDALLQSGTRVEIGSTVLELVAPLESEAPRPAPAAEVAEVADEGTQILTRPAFVVRIVESTGGESAGKEFQVAGVATIGRGEECEICLSDRGASRRHARIESTGEGRYRLRDLGSANGIWMDDRRVGDEAVAQGQRFRIGDTFLECHPPVKEKASAADTCLIRDLGALKAKVAAHVLEGSGEAIHVSGSQAVLLDDPAYAYYVASGNVEVFTVTVRDGQPLGARNHFLTVKPGQAFFGVGLDIFQRSGFLAAGKAGTSVRRIRREELLRLAERDPEVAGQVVSCVDGWVSGLSARLTRDIFPRPTADIQLGEEKATSLAPGKRAVSAGGVVWLVDRTGDLLFIGMASVGAEEGALPFPLTPQTWVELGGEAQEAVALALRSTSELLAGSMAWHALDEFHRVLAECEFINKRLAIVDEYQRLDRKARQSEAARDAAYDAIGAVLAGKHSEFQDLAPVGQVEPVLEVCRLVGQARGIRVKAPVEARAPKTFEDNLGAVANASRFRTRRVVLRAGWWKRDQGPILGLVEKTHEPVALLPRGATAYVLVDVKTRQRTPVNEEVAATLSVFGYTFYSSFPPGASAVRDLLRFGGRGLRADFWTLVAMGVLTGMLGTATPYLTGRMIDNAIPEGDRGLLFQFGMGMLLVALSTAAFKITQSMAVVRVEGKMAYALQAAVWDRLLDLPSGFFRKFGAGDLAERAAGIDAIRSVLSRAGVGGILASISSVAFVVMMGVYNVKLTVVGIGVTLVLVSCTTLGNYIQLRHQRAEAKIRGLIASLVLQLIAGVAKVRVSAAENHAFRVWAQRFSDQKRIGFSIGHAQNFVGTVSASFQVMAMLAIFGTLYYFQSSAPPGTPPPFTTGSFIAFNAAFGSFIAAMQGLADASLSLLSVVPIFERIQPILDATPETDDSKAHPGRLRGEISVSHLNFRYVEGGPWIVKDVSIKIRPGEFVAFVGASGCGKSTMLRLLLGFEKPGTGAVYYDGQDLSTLDLRAVRQQLGVVLQESRLLPTDIFRNIVGTSSHTMDEAWEAAEMAGLAEDIRQMPMGMHTVVSEGGGTFSGGQRQRLLIARALVNKPRLIYFDEATSALDNRTQAVVTNSMDRMDASRIVIAHRLSTIMNADRIFYLEAGEVREEGSYEQLMAKNGRFAELARRQIA